jgi:hypothetical protein
MIGGLPARIAKKAFLDEKLKGMPSDWIRGRY